MTTTGTRYNTNPSEGKEDRVLDARVGEKTILSRRNWSPVNAAAARMGRQSCYCRGRRQGEGKSVARRAELEESGGGDESAKARSELVRVC